MTSLAGVKIEDCRNHGDAIANAVFDVVNTEDDVCIVEDGFTVPGVLSETELTAVNAKLVAEGLEATLQN